MKLALARTIAWALLLTGWIAIGALALRFAPTVLAGFALVALWLLALGGAAALPAWRVAASPWLRGGALGAAGAVTVAALLALASGGGVSSVPFVAPLPASPTLVPVPPLASLLALVAGWALLTALASGAVREARGGQRATPEPPLLPAACGALVASIVIGDPGDSAALLPRLVLFIAALLLVLLMLPWLPVRAVPAVPAVRAVRAVRPFALSLSKGSARASTGSARTARPRNEQHGLSPLRPLSRRHGDDRPPRSRSDEWDRTTLPRRPVRLLLPAWPAGSWRDGRSWPALLAGLAMLPMMAALPLMADWCRTQAVPAQGVVALHLLAMFGPALLARRWAIGSGALAACCAALLAGGALLAAFAPPPWGLLLLAAAHGAAWGLAWSVQLWSPARRAAQGSSPLFAALGYALLTLAFGAVVAQAGATGVLWVHGLLGLAAVLGLLLPRRMATGEA